MNNSDDKTVTVVESGNGPYAQFMTAGHHVMAADEPERFGGHDTGPSPYEYLLMDAGVGMLGGAKTRRPAARPIFDGFLPFSCMLSITLFAGT